MSSERMSVRLGGGRVMGGWGIVIGSRNGVLLLQSCEWTGRMADG
jgi:hypothetical protein